MSSTVEGAIQVRDTTGLAAALEAVLFTLNRAVTVLELQDILQSPLPDIEAAATSLTEALAGPGLFLPRHHDQPQPGAGPAPAHGVRPGLLAALPARRSSARHD